MTPASLRTLMARAFAEEVKKYAINMHNWGPQFHVIWNEDNSQKGVVFATVSECQPWINERGIAAAMRVAAEHCHDCPGVMNAPYNDSTPVRAAFQTLGEMS